MIVLAIFAETTTPTFVFRRKRRHVNCSFSPAAAGTGAARLRATVRLPTGRAATAAFPGAFAVDAERVDAACAGAFARGGRAVVFFSVFSVFLAIALTLTFLRSPAQHLDN